MNPNIPECFYRISVKALILDETRTKFLIAEESDGRWDLPGGGLDWGESPQDGIKREIKEEMGLIVVSVHPNPSYFTTALSSSGETPVANVLYETTVENFDITPSDECVAFQFVTADEARTMNIFSNVLMLANLFNPKNHTAK